MVAVTERVGRVLVVMIGPRPERNVAPGRARYALKHVGARL